MQFNLCVMFPLAETVASAQATQSVSSQWTILPAVSHNFKNASASSDVLNRLIRPYSYTGRPFQYAIKRPSTIFSTLCNALSETLSLMGAFAESSELGLSSSSLNGVSPFSLGRPFLRPPDGSG